MVPSRGTAPSATTTIENERPARVAAGDQPAHLVDVEGALGDEDHVRAAGQAGVQRDPARVAAHDLQQHHPVVALGRGVQAVDGLGGHLQGGVEPEGLVGGAEVVVDGLRHAHHRHVVLGVQPRGRAQRVLAADRDQPVHAEAGQVLLELLGPAVALERVGPGGAEDGAAAGEDPARGLDRQLEVLVLERPTPAVVKPDERVAVLVDALANDRPDGGVEPRAVASAGQDPDAHAGQSTPELARTD